MKKIKGSGNLGKLLREVTYLGKYGGKLLFRSNLKQQDSTLLNLSQGPFLERNHAVLDKIQSQGR